MMKNLIILLGLLFVSDFSGQIIRPVKSNELVTDKAFSQPIALAAKYVDSLRLSQDIPGISVSVGNSKKVLWAQGFGFADLEGHLPVTVHSKFRIGSVSKSLTSIALARLIEEKALDIDAPVDQYVPTFPKKKYSFTTRQLATHTAGIRHYREDDPLNCLVRYKNVLDGLSIFSEDSLLFVPGTASGYSTYGYSLLSAVIEGASKTDYLSFMYQSVFKPLQMNDTGADYSDSIVSNRVRFYEHNKSKMVNAAQVDNSYKWAGGGLLSTPKDLDKLGAELINPRVLRKETVSLLFEPQILLNGTNTHYGFGWRIDTNARHQKIIHHGGASDGGRTFLLIYPQQDLVVAIMANMSGVTINLREAERIANYFLEAKR